MLYSQCGLSGVPVAAVRSMIIAVSAVPPTGMPGELWLMHSIDWATWATVLSMYQSIALDILLL